MLRVPVDFNTMGKDDEGRVWINTNYYPKLKHALHPGMKVVLFEEGSFEVEVTVEFDERNGWWLGRPEWSTRCDY